MLEDVYRHPGYQTNEYNYIHVLDVYIYTYI